MSWRVQVQDEPGFDRVRIAVSRPFGDGRREVLTAFSPQSSVLVNEAESINWSDMPSIDNAIVQPFLEALLRHFGGTFDARVLRNDFEFERRRVDKLVDALITVATRRA